MKRLFILLVAMIAVVTQAMALKAVKKPGFKLPDEEKVLILSDKYFYLKDVVDEYGETTGRCLHCYNTDIQTDVAMDVHIPSFMATMGGMWQDPVSGNIFITWEEGGMEIRELYVKEIDKDLVTTTCLQLTGCLPTQWNNYDSSRICNIKVNDGYVEVKGYNEENETYINDIYTLGMKKGSFPPPSEMKVEPVAVKFVKVTADGVNVRKEPDTKSSRLGITAYYGSEDDDNAEYAWEDEERIIKPYHPHKSTILISGGWETEGFVNVKVMGKDGFISSRFVSDIIPAPLQSFLVVPYSDWKAHEVKDGKYKGLWMYSMGQHHPIYFGKKTGNQIVFFGIFFEGFVYEENAPGLMKSEKYRNGEYICFGKNRAWYPDETEFGIPDVAKFTDEDIDFLYRYVKPLEREFFLVNLDGKDMFMSID